jgi:hypothetical protein
MLVAAFGAFTVLCDRSRFVAPVWLRMGRSLRWSGRRAGVGTAIRLAAVPLAESVCPGPVLARPGKAVAPARTARTGEAPRRARTAPTGEAPRHAHAAPTAPASDIRAAVAAQAAMGREAVVPVAARARSAAADAPAVPGALLAARAAGQLVAAARLLTAVPSVAGMAPVAAVPLLRVVPAVAAVPPRAAGLAVAAARPVAAVPLLRVGLAVAAVPLVAAARIPDVPRGPARRRVSRVAVSAGTGVSAALVSAGTGTQPVVRR